MKDKEKDKEDDKNKKLQVRLNNKVFCNLKDVIRCKSCLHYILDNYKIVFYEKIEKTI